MLRFLPAVAALLAMATPASVLAQAAPIDAPAGAYVVDKTHASLTWRVRHLSLSMYTARFASFDSELTLDPRVPTRSTVTATIDPRTVRTDFPFPDKEDFDKVVAERFLGGAAHPTISFRSTGLTATGKTTGRMTGDLTMNGLTRPVTLDVTLNGAIVHPFTKSPALGFSARGSLRRSDFGLAELVGPVGDEVEIQIEAEYVKKP